MQKSMIIFVLTGLLVLAVAPLWAQGTDPIAVLKSDASLEAKTAACRALALKGGKDAVPTLAPMLVNEELSHIARYALEPMPCPEAGAALRDALGKTTGRLQVGIIGSLEARKDAEAVPALIALLPAADADVAQAAAKALGKIATPEATAALEEAVAKADIPSGNLLPFCDALLTCTEALAKSGQRDQAIAIYDRVFEVPRAPQQVRAGALRGAVLTRGGVQGVPLLVKALKEDDLFDAALRIARELGDAQEVSVALAGALPALPAEKKIKLIQTLGMIGGDAAGPAVLAEAKEGSSDLRLAALRALVRMKYSPVLGLAEQLAWADDSDLAKESRDLLSYYPGEEGAAAIRAMLKNEQVAARCVAVELIGNGGLDAPCSVLMKVAETDQDESVRVAALKAVKDFTGIEEMPRLLALLLKTKSPAELQATESALGALCARQRKAPTGSLVIQKAVYGALPDGPSADVTKKVAEIVASGSLSIEATNGNFGEPAPGLVKSLRVEYTENGTPASKTAGENETLKLSTASAPPAVVDPICAALEKAQGESKLAVLRLLGSTGSSRALEVVSLAASSGDSVIKDTAQRALCEWPTADALLAVMELVQNASDPTLKVLALRGAVRLLEQSDVPAAERLEQYAVLMASAPTADEKKTVLSGLAKIHDVTALEGILRQFGDESVKAEALQAAIAIAKDLGGAAREDASLFNGKDLTGWQGNLERWKVVDGAVVGGTDEPLKQTEYMWTPPTPVADFYLCVNIKLEPNTGNTGVQFRSAKFEDGRAVGIQADAGQDVWGRLYDQDGRGKLDWNDRAEKAVKPGDWNRYEILAIGPAIWLAINGQLGAACLDLSSDCERSGLIAFQLHAGVKETVSLKIEKLIHNPKVEIAGQNAEQLIKELKIPVAQP